MQQFTLLENFPEKVIPCEQYYYFIDITGMSANFCTIL